MGHGYLTSTAINARFSKEKAYAQMAVRGLRREMSRERFNILAIEVVGCRYLQHLDEELRETETDPLQFMKLMPMVVTLPVYKDKAPWESWTLGKL